MPTVQKQKLTSLRKALNDFSFNNIRGTELGRRTNDLAFQRNVADNRRPLTNGFRANPAVHVCPGLVERLVNRSQSPAHWLQSIWRVRPPKPTLSERKGRAALMFEEERARPSSRCDAISYFDKKNYTAERAACGPHSHAFNSLVPVPKGRRSRSRQKKVSK